MTNNTSKITGDSNIVLQDINARDIIISIAKDLPIEIKQQKESLNVKLKELAETLEVIDDKVKNGPKPEAITPPEDDPAYDAIRWRRLLQALQYQRCVLFIGPEISVNSQGDSLHQEFYKELVLDYPEIEYLENEGYFSPEADEIILYDILDFYSKEFPRKNKTGRKILEQLAQVPFSLIISLCPDDTMHKVFSDYDLDHQFLSYDGTKQEVEPMTPEKPMVYNILGNATSNGRYIFTYENFYNYLNKIHIPTEIKKKIQDATHYLFIGFDFNKWYNRLLLFILEFEHKKTGAHRLTIGNKNVKEDIEKFIARQFNITFIDNEHSQFIEWLIHNVGEDGTSRNLSQGFVHKSFMKLKSLSAKVGTEDNLDELIKIEGQVGEIAGSITRFQEKLNS
ncbi:MAG: hypothetical protein EA361_07910 [Bacteroidetes bacterium]|nr:MAG: hypothetical protein EA361_07910 [Bacteroidota bacterium]